MGAEVSSCCRGGVGSPDNTFQDNDLNNHEAPQQRVAGAAAKNATDSKEFHRRFEEGLTVNLILQDKSMLTCQVRLDRANQFLLLSCEVRAIGLQDIKSILHTAEHLKRVESSAGITEIRTCAAIHLSESGNCIPLFFTNAEDKQLFVHLLDEARIAVRRGSEPYNYLNRLFLPGLLAQVFGLLMSMADVDSKKTHIYYGAIDAANLPQQPPPSLEELQASTPQVELVASSIQQQLPTTAALTSHQRLLEAYQGQQTVKTVIAPTQDDDVKLKLREYGQPICLFGEGPFERRERLRYFLAKTGIKHHELAAPEVVDSTHVDHQRLFFSEGGPALLAARRQLAQFSLPRAIKRLRADRATAGTIDPLVVENRVASYNQMLGRKLEVYVSQVGSERPLAYGKFSPDSTLIATTSWAPTVRVWNVPSCDEFGTGLRGHKERVSSATWNPFFKSSASRAIATKEEQSGLMADDNNDDKQEPTTKALSEGWHLASGGFDSDIHLWSLNSSTPMATLSGHEERVNRVECHPSGVFLASTSHDETWRLWDIPTHKELLVQEGHSTSVFGLRFHPDGSLVFTGDLGGIVKGWDLRTGRTVLPLLGHVKQVLGITINPWRPNQVATCSDDNTVRIWDIRKQRCIDMILAHNKLISEVAYEPVHGRFLLTTSYDSSLKVWSSTEFCCSRTLVGHEARVMGGDISHDGQCIASVSFDRTFKLWTLSKEDVEP